MTTLFADVILPLPLPNFYTYRVPLELNEYMKVGSRVVVQFGKKKVLTAIVAQLHEVPPKLYEAKSILSLLDEYPILNSIQLDFYYWIASYYMSHKGEVINAALPSGLKISSESRIQLNPTYRYDVELSESEKLLIDELKARDSMTYAEAADCLEVKSIYLVISSLIKKGAVLIYEEIREKYKPKVLRKVKLSDKYARDKSALEHLVSTLESKPKQLDILLKYLADVPVFQHPDLNENGIIKAELLLAEDSSDSALKTLTKNGIFEEFEIIVSRLDENIPRNNIPQNLTLSEAQQQAENQIIDAFRTQNIVLLHGVTGSGKTEVYVSLIQKVIGNGSQVLFLLPEIALTTQIVSRLRKVFGNILGIYHSKYSDNERVEVWKGIQSGSLQIIIGVRSAIFLPFDNLGLIIVDEEHETSYKQYDPAPRYHARDAAMVLAQKHHAKVLLGSATPSIETYYHATTGKWGLVTLDKRYGNAQMPEIILADSKKEKPVQGEFTPTLLHELQEAIARKEQAILFQNRRGYAPYLTCEDCGFVPQCKSCDVSLTYHMYRSELSCHYCGHRESVPTACPACGSTKIKTIGFGTEKLEEDVQLILPTARVQRMDLDTTRNKNGYQKIINSFENEEVDILVGTQMVTKGLDFDHVSLVGVFDIDRMIHFPDFRSTERVFQIATQVSGRAGRKDKKGKVVIQTAQPTHPIFRKIMENDYHGLYREEIIEREKYHYPPFCRLIKLTLKHESKAIAEQSAEQLAKLLHPILGNKRVLGPEAPVIDKIRDQYLRDIFIKLDKDKVDLKVAKKYIQDAIAKLHELKAYKNVYVVVDVDVV